MEAQNAPILNCLFLFVSEILHTFCHTVILYNTQKSPTHTYNMILTQLVAISVTQYFVQEVHQNYTNFVLFPMTYCNNSQFLTPIYMLNDNE